MTALDPAFVDALDRLHSGLQDEEVTWALTGSTSFALQGVPVEPNDIDVQTTEDGAYAIAEQFPEQVVEKVQFRASETIRSHFGELDFDGISVEVMGDLQKRLNDGSWEDPVDVTTHREYVTVQQMQIPVLSLEYEAQAYDRLGRTDRADLLREYID